MTLPEFSVHKRITISMLAFVIILGGVVAFSNLGLELLPEINFPVVSVSTRYRGAGPEEIENLVTKPVEEAVAAVPGVKNVSSVSREDVSSIIVELEWGINLDFAAQDVRDALSRITRFLPGDAEAPIVMKFDPSQMPILVYSFRGMDDLMALNNYVDDSLKPRLERMEGVGSVLVMGGLKREVNAELDKTRLEGYGISIEQVVRSLQAENLNFSSGHVAEEHHEYLMRVLGEYKSLKEIEETPVGYKKGAVIYLKDIAKVVDTHREKRHYIRLNGQEGVMMMISKQSGANTVTTINRIKKELASLAPRMPKGIEFYAVMDQGDYIQTIANETIKNAVVGGILAIIFMFFFLRNWRPTLAIALAIPISIISIFIGIYAFGYTLNILTLGGIALVVGMLVDNAVVVIENIFRHLQSGKPRIEAAKIGANEVGMAITASTLTTIAVFLPMVLGGGIAGQLSRPLGVTIVIGLLCSLLVALTIVPMVASLLFKRTLAGSQVAGAEGTRFEKFKNWYRGVLRGTLEHRGRTIGIALIAFAVSIAAVFIIGFEFIPTGDAPTIMMSAKMEPGTNLEETNRIVQHVEKEFVSLPEMDLVAAMVGPSGGGGGMGGGTIASDVNQATIMGRLVDLDKRKRKSDEVTDYLRKRMPMLGAGEFQFSDMGGGMMGGGMGGAPVQINVFGNDVDKLSEICDEIKKEIGDVQGLRDITTSLEEGKPEFQFVVDRDKAYRYGLTVAQVGQAIQRANFGVVATRYREKGEEYDIRVRFDESDRNAISKILRLPISTPAGGTVPLAEVARVQHIKGPIQIDRENRVRRVSVNGNTTGRALGNIVRDIQKKLKDMHLPSGYFIEYGGTYEELQEALVVLSWSFVAAIILIYMIMAAMFESLSQPLVIMGTVPLGIIGVVLGLAIFRTPLSTPAFMGMIILAGIVVNNGIVMIDYVNQLRRRGMEKHEALIEAAATRLRPILITSLTTILGVLPMALSTTEGAEMRAPMAIAIGGGLIVATILTLFVVPSLYSVVDHVSYRTRNRVKKVVHGSE